MFKTSHSFWRSWWHKNVLLVSPIFPEAYPSGLYFSNSVQSVTLFTYCWEKMDSFGYFHDLNVTHFYNDNHHATGESTRMLFKSISSSPKLVIVKIVEIGLSTQPVY